MKSNDFQLAAQRMTEARRDSRLKKLYELSMTLCGDPREVFKHVARIIGELFDVRVVCLSEIRGDQLFFVSVYVDGQVYQDAGQCPLSITPCATVEDNKDIQIYHHVCQLFPDATFLKSHNAHSYCGFPVLDNNRNVIAVTCLLDDKPHEFSEEDHDVLRIFGQRISMELERQRHIREKQKNEQNLQQLQLMMAQAEQLAALGSWRWDIQEGKIYWSPEMYRLNQMDPVEYPVITPERAILSIVPEDRDRIKANIEHTLKHGTWRPIEYRIRLENGQCRTFKAEGLTVEFENSSPKQMVGFVQDISALKETQNHLEESLSMLRVAENRQRELRIAAQIEQQRMSALLSAMNIGILFEDKKGHVDFVNPAFKRLWAIEESLDLEGMLTLDVLSHSTHRLARPDHASKYIMQVLDTNEISERFEIDLYDGRILTQLSYPVAGVDGAILGRLWIYEDITQERQTAQQLLYLAERDPLTGLQNRHRFQEQLEQYLHTAKRNEIKFALLYFDLDEFKFINDTFGHRAGDTVLIRIAGEISSLVRSNEVFARLGGDEFAVLVHQKQESEAIALATRIVHAISSIPFHFRGNNIRLTASVGIAIYPDHGIGMEDLIAHADAAMYQSKSMGKNTCCVYDAKRDLSKRKTARITWAKRIADALQEDCFELHFQGIYDVFNQTLRHIEVLVRMRDSRSRTRLIMPGQFIPVAEKSEQIIDIDKWVLKRSIAMLAANPSMPPLAVNISGRTIDDSSLPYFIQTELRDKNVDSERLIIELTETAAVSDIQDAQRFIEAIRHAGCIVCLDDFGSGFSTFTYLKYLNVEILKIDGIFIRDLVNHRDNQILVKAMVDVARGLGKIIVAEFVENAETLKMVQELDIHCAQGYYLNRPSADIPASIPFPKVK